MLASAPDVLGPPIGATPPFALLGVIRIWHESCRIAKVTFDIGCAIGTSLPKASAYS